MTHLAVTAVALAAGAALAVAGALWRLSVWFAESIELGFEELS